VTYWLVWTGRNRDPTGAWGLGLLERMLEIEGSGTAQLLTGRQRLRAVAMMLYRLRRQRHVSLWRCLIELEVSRKPSTKPCCLREALLSRR
jgi:hypothetical protein